MPVFWILAGPNGAGKSTFVDSGLFRAVVGRDLPGLNADVATAEILARAPDTPDANLRAAIEIDRRVADNIERGIDFMVETVLSSDKYLDDIERARELGYAVGVVYVALGSPAASASRVHQRRLRGGHDVPRDRTDARWQRSLDMLGRIAPVVDALFVIDNTDPQDRVLLARKTDGALALLAPGRIPQLDAVLLAAGAVAA